MARTHVRSWGVALFAALALTPVLGARDAAAAHVDILAARQGAALVTAGFDFDTSSVLPGQRVFPVELDTFHGATNPGFNALSSGLPPGWTPLPGSASLTFQVLAPALPGRNLTWWSGSGAVSFTPVPAGETFLLSRQTGPFTFLTATADGSASPVPGFEIDVTTSTGFLHKHLALFLLGGGANPPTPGVYLLPISLSMPGVTASPPVWLVFGEGVDAPTLASAEAHVDGYLVPDCGDGVDNDLDGLVDAPADGGCRSASDLSETADCEDGLDGDGDGLIDYPADPGCYSPTWNLEDPACSNGLDDDGDTFVDLADPQCGGNAWQNHETPPPSACGLGPGIVPALALLGALQRRRRRERPVRARRIRGVR